jgi:thiol-disulfide isomerase/thioredoxin
MRRNALPLVGAAVVILAVAAGLSQTGTHNVAPRNSAPSPAQVRAALTGSPAPLAALHEQANRLMPASVATVERLLSVLRGYPVVVNKWASWCGPCRGEFPFFQQASVRFGRRVAFFGLNSADNEADARAFLNRFPVSYPSYADPREEIARWMRAPNTYPETLFFDRAGRINFVRQGGYPTQAKLNEDIQRYALERRHA